MLQGNRRARVFVGVFLVLAAVALPAAGAGELGAPDVAAWLEANDLSADDVTIQRGSNLYAGPSCPAGASCVEITGPIVQIVVDGGIGRVECGDASCLVMQHARAATLTADCTVNETGDNLTQNCTGITQTNGEEDNVLTINMQATAQSGAFNVMNGINHAITQNVQCRQSNVNGNNLLNSIQRIRMNANLTVTVPAEVTQQAYTNFDCAQTNTGSGSSTATILGEQIEDVDVTIGSGNVFQNAINGTPTMRMLFEQKTNSGNGTTDLDLNQNLTADASAVNVGGNVGIFQGPGSPSGLSDNNAAGLVGRLDMDSVSGTSTGDVDFSRAWVANANAPLGGTRNVVQDNGLDCCLGLDKINRTCTICELTFNSDLRSNKADALQRIAHIWRWSAENTVTATGSMSFDGDAPSTDSEGPAKIVNRKRVCQDDVSCTSQAGHPMSFDADIRRDSPSPQQPADAFFESTEAPSNGVVSFRVTAQNLSNAPLSDIKVVIPIPSGTSVLTMDPTCKRKGGTVECKFGIGTTLGTKAVVNSFRLASGLSDGTTITFTATGTVGNNPSAGPVQAPATVTVNNSIS